MWNGMDRRFSLKLLCYIKNSCFGVDEWVG